MSSNRITKLLLLATTALGAGPMTAHAQDAEPPRASQIEDIVVTARRTAESLQTTPVSVTALSQSFLEQQNVQQVDKIAQFAPNLVISRQPSSLAAASVLIRGIGQT
jgi:iron complex outermembrane receptor protein